jgi:hypothetical protein
MARPKKNHNDINALILMIKNHQTKDLKIGNKFLKLL